MDRLKYNLLNELMNKGKKVYLSLEFISSNTIINDENAFYFNTLDVSLRSLKGVKFEVDTYIEIVRVF